MKTVFQDLFLYCAKFADKAGVLKNFNTVQGSAEYLAFKSKVEALPDDPLIPGIKDFVLTASEESVKKRIMTFKGVYLFLDYGELTSTENNFKVQEDRFRLALTVARPLASNSFNMAEEIVLNDELLSIILSIRDYIKADKSDSFIKRLNFPFEIQPFNASDLSNSFGWTLVFEMSGVGMI